MPEVGKIWTWKRKRCVVVAWELVEPRLEERCPAFVVLQKESRQSATGRLSLEGEEIYLFPQQALALIPLLEEAARLAQTDTAHKLEVKRDQCDPLPESEHVDWTQAAYMERILERAARLVKADTARTLETEVE